MPTRLVLVILALAVLAAAPRAQAQCAGFSDVFTSSAFCNDVNWLKNRQVTLGCTTTTYCPNDPVIRLQMAAFMNRVGNVITPHVFSTEDSGGALDLLSNHILCITPDLPARDYSRRVLADAALSYDVTGQVNLEVAVARSINGGAWTTVLSGARPRASANARNHQHVVLNATGLFQSSTDLVRYAVSVGRVAPFLNASITAWACHLQVFVVPEVEL